MKQHPELQTENPATQGSSTPTSNKFPLPYLLKDPLRLRPELVGHIDKLHTPFSFNIEANKNFFSQDFCDNYPNQQLKDDVPILIKLGDGSTIILTPLYG
ncbi:hypothetical protein PAEPH01_2102 [Pancytospora epiphaga]|nr:hypothetical protein PAEPH01_2102 [Pancytospora epiphaga]